MDFNGDFYEKLLAGGSGSAIAAWIARATGFNLVMMFFGGLMAAFFLGPLTANMFNLMAYESGVGFTVGFLSICIMRKAVEMVEEMTLGRLIKAFIGRRGR